MLCPRGVDFVYLLAEDDIDVCTVCGRGGDLLLCDGCTASFHIACTNPRIYEVPQGDWFCGICACEHNSVSLTPIGSDEMHNRFWFLGGQLFCEKVESGEFSQLVDQDIARWKMVKTGTPSERSLARNVRRVFPKLNRQRLDQRVCNLFTVAQAPVQGDLLNRPLYTSNYINRFPPMRFSTGKIFGKFAIRESNWPVFASESLATLEHIKSRLSQLANALPTTMVHSTWNNLKLTPQHRSGDVPLDTLKAALLDLESAMRPSCFANSWHETPGFFYSLSQSNLVQLEAKVYMPMVNEQLPRDFYTSKQMSDAVPNQFAGNTSPDIPSQNVDATESVTVTRSGRASVRVQRSNSSDEISKSSRRYSSGMSSLDRNLQAPRRMPASIGSNRSGYAEWHTSYKEVNDTTIHVRGVPIRVVQSHPPLVRSIFVLCAGCLHMHL
jgi:hypothetical protein